MRFFLPAFICLFTVQVTAQETEKPRLQLFEAGLGAGWQSAHNENFTDAEWAKLPLFHNDAADSNGYLRVYPNARNYAYNTTFQAQLQFRLTSDKKLQWLFGINAGYAEAVNAIAKYYRYVPMDTVSGKDTLYTRSYEYVAGRLTIGLRAAVTTDPDKAVSAFAGFSAGISVVPHGIVRTEFDQVSGGDPESLVRTTNQQRTEAVFGYAVALPVGVTFRFSTEADDVVLSRLSFTAETQFGLNGFSIPELEKSFVKTSFQLGGRLNYRFNN